MSKYFLEGIVLEKSLYYNSVVSLHTARLYRWSKGRNGTLYKTLEKTYDKPIYIYQRNPKPTRGISMEDWKASLKVQQRFKHGELLRFDDVIKKPDGNYPYFMVNFFEYEIQ